MEDYRDNTVLPFADAAAFVFDTLANADEKTLKWLSIKPETRDIFCNTKINIVPHYVPSLEKSMRTIADIDIQGFWKNDEITVRYNQNHAKKSTLAEKIAVAAHEFRHGLDIIDAKQKILNAPKKPPGILSKVAAAFMPVMALVKLPKMLHALEIRANFMEAQFNPKLFSDVLNDEHPKKLSFLQNKIDMHVFGYPGGAAQKEVQRTVLLDITHSEKPHPLYGRDFDVVFDNWKKSKAAKTLKPI